MSWGHLFIFHQKNTAQNLYGEFSKFTRNERSLYHCEKKQSDKWSVITVISPQIFKKYFPVIHEIIQETATMLTNEFDARD